MTDGGSTILRTIRISRKLDLLLRRDAKTKGTSVNGLLATILTKYAEWDRNAEKFGFTQQTDQTFRGILNATDDERLTKVATDLGARVPKEFLLFWFKRVDLEGFLFYIALTCKYGGVGACETEGDGKYHTLPYSTTLAKNGPVLLDIFLMKPFAAVLG